MKEAKRRKVEEEGIDKLKAVDSIDEVKREESIRSIR